MLVRRSYLFAIFPLISLSFAEFQNDLSRIKRSPYNCRPSQQAPPPLPTPQAQLPRYFLYPSPANSNLQWEQFIQRQQQNERNSGDQGRYDAQPYGTGYEQNQFRKYNDGNRPPCEKCGRKNLAVSNAKSDTGDAIAIAVSNGNKG